MQLNKILKSLISALLIITCFSACATNVNIKNNESKREYQTYLKSPNLMRVTFYSFHNTEEGAITRAKQMAEGVGTYKIIELKVEKVDIGGFSVKFVVQYDTDVLKAQRRAEMELENRNNKKKGFGEF